jgi:outer membrane biosynthesis protein TonB
MRSTLVAISLGVLLGCAKQAKEVPAAAAPNPAFDQKWASLAQKDVDVFYIEDDRGEGLMGNVRRARKDPAGDDKGGRDPGAPPATLSQEEVQRVIRQNLPGVRACYLRIARNGDQRSGKAIVSFEIGAGGDVKDTKVDAPSFEGTSLPGCVSGTVSRWSFPKSQQGGMAISYPFVFVGG